jgi:hypothetical protein
MTRGNDRRMAYGLPKPHIYKHMGAWRYNWTPCETRCRRTVEKYATLNGKAASFVWRMNVGEAQEETKKHCLGISPTTTPGMPTY